MRKWSSLREWASCLVFMMAFSLTMPIATFASSAEKKSVKKVRAKKARVIRAKTKPTAKLALVAEKAAPVEAAPAPVVSVVAPAKPTPTPKVEPIPTPAPKPKTEADAATVSGKEKEEEKADELIRIKRRLAALEATVAGNAEDYKALKAKSDKAALDEPIRADEAWVAKWSLESQGNLERAWYNACYVQKDHVSCVNFSKLIIRIFPSPKQNPVCTVIINDVVQRQWREFTESLEAFYRKAPELKSLERLFQAGTLISYMPYVSAQMALAGASMGLIDEAVLDVVKPYVERALQMYAPAEPPSGVLQGMERKDWDSFRKLVLAQGNQFLGYYALNKQHEPESALRYLAMAIAVKGDGSQGWKDPLNYYLRWSRFDGHGILLAES